MLEWLVYVWNVHEIEKMSYVTLFGDVLVFPDVALQIIIREGIHYAEDERLEWIFLCPTTKYG